MRTTWVELPSCTGHRRHRDSAVEGTHTGKGRKPTAPCSHCTQLYGMLKRNVISWRCCILAKKELTQTPSTTEHEAEIPEAYTKFHQQFFTERSPSSLGTSVKRSYFKIGGKCSNAFRRSTQFAAVDRSMLSTTVYG